MKNRILVLGLLLSTSWVTSVNAALIINGSFEDNNVSNWSVFQTINGWDTLSGAGIEIQTNSTLGSIDAQDGNNYVELDSHNNSTMGQTLIDLNIGQTYDLSFWYSSRRSTTNNDNGVNVLWGEDSGSLIEFINIEDVLNTGSWTNFDFSLTATASTMVLAFQADGVNNSYGGLIDNVEMNAVPEPSIIALFGLGLVGLGFARRKTRS